MVLAARIKQPLHHQMREASLGTWTQGSSGNIPAQLRSLTHAFIQCCCPVKWPQNGTFFISDPLFSCGRTLQTTKIRLVSYCHVNGNRYGSLTCSKLYLGQFCFCMSAQSTQAKMWNICAPSLSCEIPWVEHYNFYCRWDNVVMSCHYCI